MLLIQYRVFAYRTIAALESLCFDIKSRGTRDNHIHRQTTNRYSCIYASNGISRTAGNSNEDRMISLLGLLIGCINHESLQIHRVWNRVLFIICRAQHWLMSSVLLMWTSQIRHTLLIPNTDTRVPYCTYRCRTQLLMHVPVPKQLTASYQILARTYIPVNT